MYLNEFKYSNNERFKIRNNQIIKGSFKIENELGKGSFSNVFKIYDIELNKNFALKVAKKNNADILKDSLNEINLLSNLKEKENHNITKIYKYFYHDDHLCVVFKLYHFSLGKYLKKYGGFSYYKTFHILKQLLSTLDYLQTNTIIHRDIKLDNILFKDKYLSDIILIDFNIATKLKDTKNTCRKVQTFWYRAPEIYLELNYDYRLDIWSLGCIAFELFFNQILFKCYCEERLFIEHNLYIDFPENDFIKKMPNNYSSLYDSISDPTIVKCNNLYYSPKKNQFIEKYMKKKDSKKVLDFVFKCCKWDCFKRPFAKQIIIN